MPNTDYVVRLQGQDNLTQTIDKAKQSINDFGKVAQTDMEKVDAKFQKVINSSAPLKRQLRDLQQLMAQMNFQGLSGTEKFTEIAQAAGKIKDAIADAQTATQRFANDTMGLQAGIQALQGVAGAASAVQGAMALLGTSNEDVARSIQKVQGALAILNGVQALANSLNKDSVLMHKVKQIRLAATTAMEQTNTTATIANTAATATNTTAIIASNTAQKAWNITKAVGKALLGDLSGLLIVGATALATYAIATGNSANETKKLNGELSQAKTFEDLVNDSRKQSLSTISDERNRIESLTRIIDNANTSYDDKVKAINQLKSIVPSYTATITNEGTVHSNAATSIRNHIAALDDLQKALAAFKVGQAIQDELSKADFDKFLADSKVKTQRTKVQQGQQRLQSQREQQPTGLQTLSYNPMTQSDNTRTPSLRATEKQIQSDNKALKAAETEQTAADEAYKAAKLNKTTFDNWVKSQGTVKAQTAVTLANGDVNKALDIYTGRGEIANGSGTRNTPKSGGKATVGTVVNKDAEELVKYQTTIKNIQTQYNEKLINELEYKTKVRDAEKQHLQYLLQQNKATTDDLERYQLAETDLKSYTIQINYEGNINDIEKQFEDGFITAQQRAEGIADALKNVYIENLKVGSATKEMADNYNKAKQYADLLKKAENIDEDTEKLISTKYENKTSSFDEATKKETNVETFDIQLSGIQQQMDFNDQLIEQLKEMLDLYNELGLTGSEGYQKINDKLNQTIEENEELGTQATDISTKQDTWLNNKEKIEGYQESISNLGNVFSNLGGAMDGTTQQWLNFTGQALDGAAKLIPIIQKLIMAKQAEAMASISAEGAKLPPPANIAAILSGIAIITSVFASIPKFASGGVISGGSRYGDNVLARVNSGEMIINASQQSNLWHAIESGDFGNGGGIGTQTVNFKIKGSDLYGSLKNFGKQAIKTGKNINI